MLGDVALTIATGTNARTGQDFAVGENIFGPFEAGFGSQQDNILRGLGCNTPSAGYVEGGMDTKLAEQKVAYACGVTLPRVEGGEYISLLDECGGHTREYHFHERMSCLYSLSGTHSAKIGELRNGQFLYGKWEDYSQSQLPLLDACGGHWGRTPESPNVDVYHYHMQENAPFTIGCIGPNDDNSLVTVAQCRSFYTGCDGDLTTVTTSAGSIQYDLWCPCWDAAGLNTGIDIQELAVFGGAATGATSGTVSGTTPSVVCGTMASGTTTSLIGILLVHAVLLVSLAV